jgi:hypothetical protein
VQIFFRHILKPKNLLLAIFLLVSCALIASQEIQPVMLTSSLGAAAEFNVESELFFATQFAWEVNIGLQIPLVDDFGLYFKPELGHRTVLSAFTQGITKLRGLTGPFFGLHLGVMTEEYSDALSSGTLIGFLELGIRNYYQNYINTPLLLTYLSSRLQLGFNIILDVGLGLQISTPLLINFRNDLESSLSSGINIQFLLY